RSRFDARKTNLEPYDHVKGHLVQSCAEVGERTRLACCFRRPRRKSFVREYDLLINVDPKPFDEPSNGARQRRALPIKTSTAPRRSAPRLSPYPTLRADDKGSVPHYYQSPRAASGERLRQLLFRALPRTSLLLLRFLRRRIFPVD